MPQAGHYFVDGVVGACFRDGSQVCVNGSGAGGRKVVSLFEPCPR
jgi:hypothetical protein